MSGFWSTGSYCSPAGGCDRLNYLCGSCTDERLRKEALIEKMVLEAVEAPDEPLTKEKKR